MKTKIAVAPIQLVNRELADVSLADLIAMRTLALQPDCDHGQLRQDAFTAALFSARARRQVAAAELVQTRTRMRLAVEYMEGTRGHHPLSASAAETAASRDAEYLRTKEATAEAAMVAGVAEAIARDLMVLAGGALVSHFVTSDS